MAEEWIQVLVGRLDLRIHWQVRSKNLLSSLVRQAYAGPVTVRSRGTSTISSRARQPIVTDRDYPVRHERSCCPGEARGARAGG